MSPKASFATPRKELLAILTQMKKIESAARKKNSVLDVTLLDSYIQLVIPGAELKLRAVTQGSGRFSIRLWYFTSFIRDDRKKEILCYLDENRLTNGNRTIAAQTTFFESDAVLRTIDLPANYTQMDLMRVALSGRYTPEEIAFSKLDTATKQAVQEAISDVDRVSLILSKYGLDRTQVNKVLLDYLAADQASSFQD